MKKNTEGPGADSREKSRRRLLQLLAVGGVFAGGRMLPETWVKPLINEAVLPAHAQMSPADDEPEPDLAVDDTTDDISPDLTVDDT